MDTTVIEYMSTMSCWVVSWVFLVTLLLWTILVVIKCNVKWNSNRHTYEVEESRQLKSHRKLNSHEGGPRVTRVNHHPWLYIPPHCMSKGIFDLGSSSKALERSPSSLRSKGWLQCPTIRASDVHCKHVSWNFLLILEVSKGNMFFMHGLWMFVSFADVCISCFLSHVLR